MYISLHCHHQNDFCIKMGSDESRFNVSEGSDGQSHKTAEAVSHRGPSAYQPNALPLGQTGSHQRDEVSVLLTRRKTGQVIAKGLHAVRQIGGYFLPAQSAADPGTGTYLLR